MLKSLQKVKDNFSGNRAFAHVAEVAQHHRIQASPGFRAAAKYCQEVLTKEGLAAEIISYPADGSSKYWTQEMMEEWHCHDARLDLLSPYAQPLASFQDNAMSVIQRSIGTPPEGLEADVVLLDQGDDPAAYADWDLEGKIVFSNYNLNKILQWAVGEKGAVGIISDYMLEFPPVRHRYDIPDALQYTSFWWTGHEKQCFGFVLSPKAGDKLRQTCLKMRAEHRLDPKQAAYPRVRAQVDARLYAGAIENVTALIPGASDEEIIVAAHLCHPRASANDNASGVGVALETMRVLKQLIDRGDLPAPRRSIRLLLIPEMTGTYAYLADNEDRIDKMLAAINLDMVGEDQDLCKSTLIAEYPPQASASFVGDLLAAIMEEMTKEAKNLAGTSSYAYFRHAVAPFSGGSDHYIFSDPTVNVPCPMLIQWPDKYYHTSADTLDKVDPAMLYRVGCITATYLYCLAQMDLAAARWMLSVGRNLYLKQVNNLLQASATAQTQTPDGEALALTHQRLQHGHRQKEAELTSLNRFLQGAEQAEFAPLLERELAFLKETTAALWQHHLQEQDAAGEPAQVTDLPQEDYRLVPRRLFRGPVSMRGQLESLPEADRQTYRDLVAQHPQAAQKTPNYLVYWADGRRNIAEIDHLVHMEIGISNPAFALGYFRLLEKLGLVRVDRV